MTGGISGLFSRALDGLNVSSKGLAVTSNNIANVNTPGYSRQVFNQASRGVFGDGTFGGGVDGLSVTTIVNPFIERQLLNEHSDFGKLDGRRLTLSQMEEVMKETENSGIGVAINDYFNSWSDLSQDPSSGSFRQIVRERGREVVNQFNSLSTQLQNLRSNLSSTIESRLTQTNAYLEDVAEFNERIRTASDDAARADLLSQRQLTLNKLSEEMDITYFEDNTGQITVQAEGSGFALVSRNMASTLSASDDLSEGGQIAINATLPGGSSSVDITRHIDKGQIGGLMVDRNVTLNNTLSDLNELAYEFATQVNAVHSANYGLDGNDGHNFFGALADSSNAASSIQLDSDIENDLDAIAAAGDDPSVSGVGDNAGAQAMVALQTSNTMSGGTRSFSEFYSGMVTSIGVEAGQVNRQHSSKALVLDNLQVQRESVSGVNMDEEAANLIRYQKAFEGSARIMQTANRLIDILIEL